MARQDKFVEWVTQLLPEDDPIRGVVFLEISHLRRLGVDVTESIAQKVIATRREQWLRRADKTANRTMPSVGLDAAGDVKVYESVVYYMLFGDRVKIGTTGNIHQRVRTINPDELLVTESGDSALERYRHQQFANLRVRGEWFRYEGALVQHVADLRKAGHCGVRNP